MSWKVYYTVNNGECDPEDCPKLSASASFRQRPSDLGYSNSMYVNSNPNPAACTAPAQPSAQRRHVQLVLRRSQPHRAYNVAYYFADLKNNTLPAFAFIESGSGLNDEHPGTGNRSWRDMPSVDDHQRANGQPSWKDSAFFFGYDEGGGPYDHVPPVPSHTNDWTDNFCGGESIPDISTIAVNADSLQSLRARPAPGDLHCDLNASGPRNDQEHGCSRTSRVCARNLASAFRTWWSHRSRKNTMSRTSHGPHRDHQVRRESLHLDAPQASTARDAAQPNLLDFFDFTGKPWATPPTPPAPVTQSTPPGQGSCQPAAFH